MNINIFPFILFILLMIGIFYYRMYNKKEHFISVRDIPENIKKQIGKPYNIIIPKKGQKNLTLSEAPFILPVTIKRVDPYDNISVCEIDRTRKKHFKHIKKKGRIISKPQKKCTILKKKFYDNSYGITQAPGYDEYIKIIGKTSELGNNNSNIHSHINYTQGNICKLSPWSLWSECNKKCGDNYGTKTRTRKVLKEPLGCYSPFNPILEQKIPCHSSICFCKSGC